MSRRPTTSDLLVGLIDARRSCVGGFPTCGLLDLKSYSSVCGPKAQATYLEHKMREDLLSKRIFLAGLCGLPWLWIVHVLYYYGRQREEEQQRQNLLGQPEQGEKGAK